MRERLERKDHDQFDHLAESLTVHPSKSQILIEVNSERNTLQEALAILRDLNMHQVQHKILQKGDPACILLFLTNEDMREAAYKLSEAGFTKVKGVNPQRRHERKRD